MDDREIKMLAAKVVEADPKALGAAIEEVIKTKKTLDEVGGTTYCTLDSICGAGGVLDKIGVKFGFLPKQGISKFMKMSDDLELHRYRGADFVKLIGRRPAKSGCKPKCYEIFVNRMADPLQFREGHDVLSPVAHLYVDGKVCFSIVGTGCSFNDVEHMAVSALHRLVKRRNNANERRHRSRKRKQIEKMALKGVSE